jgi:hypothetical protein
MVIYVVTFIVNVKAAMPPANLQPHPDYLLRMAFLSN